MIKYNRKDQIKKELLDNQFVKVSDLQKKFDVTEMTIRRDLTELEKEGFLERVHGGAKISDNVSTVREFNRDKRSKFHTMEKNIIAQKAAKLINDYECVFIGSSTTNELIYKYISAKNVKIITNCLYIFMEFSQNTDFETILIGGKYDHEIESFSGTLAINSLKDLSFDKAFIGTNGISNNKLSASNDEEGMLHKIVLDNSKCKYAVCDNSKFGVDAFYKFYDCRDLDGVITNDIEQINNVKINTTLI